MSLAREPFCFLLPFAVICFLAEKAFRGAWLETELLIVHEKESLDDRVIQLKQPLRKDLELNKVDDI